MHLFLLLLVNGVLLIMVSGRQKRRHLQALWGKGIFVLRTAWFSRLSNNFFCICIIIILIQVYSWFIHLTYHPKILDSIPERYVDLNRGSWWWDVMLALSRISRNVSWSEYLVIKKRHMQKHEVLHTYLNFKTIFTTPIIRLD